MVDCISEITKNLLKGKIPLKSRQLKCLCRHKRILREVANKRNSLKRRRRLVQTGGFLGALIGPALGLITTLLGSLINN